MKQFNNENKSMLKTIFKMSLPIMVANFVHTLYNLTDAYFLGKLGVNEISAPNVSFSVVFFLATFGMTFAMAGTTLIAQSFGKGDDSKVDFYLGQTTMIVFAISILIMIIGVGLSKYILILMQVPEEVMPFAYDYMRIIFMGLPFMFGFFVLQSVLHGIGDMMTPLYIKAFTVTLNIALDPLIIFGIGPFPALGVKGAAIATVFSNSIATIIAFYILIKGSKGIKLKLKNMRYDRKSFMLFIKIGLPASIGQSLSALGFTVLQGVVNTFGPAVIAAFGVGNRIIGMFNMPAMGIARAITTLVGQHLGAKDTEGAKRVTNMGMVTSMMFLIPSMIFTFFFGGYLIQFFVDDVEAIKYGTILFRVVSPSVIFFGLITVVLGAFQGSGDTKPVMILHIVRLWGIRVPLAYFLSYVVLSSPLGIWIAMFASNSIVAAMGYYWFKTNRWIKILDT